MKCSNGNHSHNFYLGFFSFFHRSKKGGKTSTIIHSLSLIFYALFWQLNRNYSPLTIIIVCVFFGTCRMNHILFWTNHWWALPSMIFWKKHFVFLVFYRDYETFKIVVFTQRSRWTCPIIKKSVDNYKDNRDLKQQFFVIWKFFTVCYISICDKSWQENICRPILLKHLYIYKKIIKQKQMRHFKKILFISLTKIFWINDFFKRQWFLVLVVAVFTALFKPVMQELFLKEEKFIYT